MSIPEGFKLVPVEPTAEILAELASDVYPDDNSAGKALQRLRGCDVVFPKYEVEAAVGKYQRMLASAPTPPQPIYDEAKEREVALGSLVPEAELALKALNVAVSVYDVELADSARRGLRLIIAALKPAEGGGDEAVNEG